MRFYDDDNNEYVDDGDVDDDLLGCRVVHGSLFLDPTRPGETLTRPDPRLQTKSLTRPGSTLLPYVHSLIE